MLHYSTTELAKSFPRFWSKVDIRSPEECWPWKAMLVGGYGHFKLDRKHVKSHRLAYELLVGPIPSGLTVDHLCRNRACANPKHLEIVTPRENTLRGVGPTAVNAGKTHCIHGHEFNFENTRYRPNGIGRQCRKCHAAQGRRIRASRRLALRGKV